MIALLYKDLVSVRRSMLLLLVLVVALGAYGATNAYAETVLLVFILVPTIVCGMLFGVDAVDRVDQTVIPAPVSRARVVVSRYMITWLFAIVALAASLIMRWLRPETAALPLPMLCALALTLTTLVSSIQLPLIYRFGVERSRLIFFILYVAVFAGFSVLGSQRERIEAVLPALRAADTRLAALAVLLFGLAVNGISCRISVGIYRNKTF